MLKFITLGTLVGLGLLLAASDVQAGHRRGCCCGGAVVVPAPAPAAAAAPTAQAPQAYRTYSYQPAQTSYRPYGSWVTGRAYESAINKALGRGF